VLEAISLELREPWGRAVRLRELHEGELSELHPHIAAAGRDWGR
jgi:hypothetical protein